MIAVVSSREPGTRLDGRLFLFRRLRVNSSVIGKIEKAKRYAQERTRMRFTALSVDFHGENGDHQVS